MDTEGVSAFGDLHGVYGIGDVAQHGEVEEFFGGGDGELSVFGGVKCGKTVSGVGRNDDAGPSCRDNITEFFEDEGGSIEFYGEDVGSGGVGGCGTGGVNEVGEVSLADGEIAKGLNGFAGGDVDGGGNSGEAGLEEAACG